jgi:hypothetical protein
MQHITATDAAANLIALTLFGLIPPLQAGELALIWEALQLPLTGFLLLVIGAFLKNFIYTRTTVDRWLADLEKERERERADSDKAYAAMMTEHLKAMEMQEKERSREREQSQVRLDATIKHYETRLAEKESVQAQTTALLARTVALLNEQEKAAA